MNERIELTELWLMKLGFYIDYNIESREFEPIYRKY